MREQWERYRREQGHRWLRNHNCTLAEYLTDERIDQMEEESQRLMFQMRQRDADLVAEGKWEANMLERVSDVWVAKIKTEYLRAYEVRAEDAELLDALIRSLYLIDMECVGYGAMGIVYSRGQIGPELVLLWLVVLRGAGVKPSDMLEGTMKLLSTWAGEVPPGPADFLAGLGGELKLIAPD